MAESLGRMILAHVEAITKNMCQNIFVRVIQEIKTRDSSVVGMDKGGSYEVTKKGRKRNVFPSKRVRKGYC